MASEFKQQTELVCTDKMVSIISNQRFASFYFINKANNIETDGEPLILYPNPAIDYITAAYLPDSTYDETTPSYEIYNILGIKVADGELQKTDSQHFQKEIPIQNLPSGVYFVVINNRRRLVTGKFQKD
jgi:hypothetical protein